MDKNSDVDVTSHVAFDNPDDELMPLRQCVCGKKFETWDCVISIYRDTPWECECGTKLYFSQSITVYQVRP